MDETLRHDNPNPMLTANIVSKIFFCWLTPLFKKGHKGWLEETDMYNTCPEDQSTIVGQKLEAEWEKELKRRNQGKEPSLLKALIRTFGMNYILLGLVYLIEEAVIVAQPLFLAELLGYFTPDSPTTRVEAWVYASLLLITSALLTVMHHPFFFNNYRTCMRVRLGCCSLMFKKVLRLSNKSLSECSVGQIVNLMSNDVARFDRGMMFFHFLWVGPLEAAAVLIILWYRVGPSVLAGMVAIFLIMPTQTIMGKLFSRLRSTTAVHTDKRVKVMNEIISGMKIIKMYCWEKPFGDLVEKLRSEEVRQLSTTRRIQACVFGPSFATTQLSVFLLFLAFTLAGQEDEMRPGTVFLTMGLLQALRLPCGLFLPLGSQHLAETLIVIKRIENFLLKDELKRVQADEEQGNGVSVKYGSTDESKKMKGRVEMKNVTALWEDDSESNALENISLSVSPGELVAVIGPVGSGKTSLLMSILRELLLKSGSLTVHGKVAYVSQQSWVFSGSVRQNILFGEPFDKARYDTIIKITALTKDLTILPKGDATLIGDRGVTLSGGQRARVSLARALYMDADIYLLDDPLAAVDTAVGRHIFEKCILKYLKDKPRILVTHQVQLLPAADNIVTLTDGKIVSQGTYVELSQSGVDFCELLKISEEEEEEYKKHGPRADIRDTKDEPLSEDIKNPESLLQRKRADSLTSLTSLDEDYEPEPVQLPDEEERETGSIDFTVIVEYIKAGAGLIKFLVLVFFFLLAQVLYVASDWWLARWSNKVEDRHSAVTKREEVLAHGHISTSANLTSEDNGNSTLLSDIPDVDTYFNLYVLAGLILALCAAAFVRALLYFQFAVDAGQTLHNTMFARLLRVESCFFDTNPVGRVLNRFSKDVGQIDDHLPWTMFDFLQNAFLALGIVVVAGVFNPWVFIPTVPLAVLLLMLRRYYVQTSRSVKRLEGTTRSPVFSYLSASLQGIHTIRAMHMEERFSAEFDAHQDRHTSAWFLFLATARWLGVRLDWLSVVFIACVVFASVLAASSLDAGFVGLSITYTISTMGLFQWVVRQSTEVENQLISVERIVQYSRLPVEAEFESKPDQKPPASWPARGSIQAKDVCLQYSATGPHVLKHLTFDIRHAEKIGIVGRTGAGKSSLITTLFRMVEPQGTLLIDGVNIQHIGLHDLRGAISIIPQDPVLFTGSVRKNLDPFQEYSDDQIWRALDEVQLREHIAANSEGLYMEVNEGGANFSAGQRQLMCLARAVLGHTRILIIDEATANVDPITDELIQKTIRNKFQNCTVLTIAHRLHTIIDSDRIMVLDVGEIVELDTPMALLSKGEGGAFYSMVEQMGKQELEHLTEVARSQQTLSLSHRLHDVIPVLNDDHHTLSPAPQEHHGSNGTLLSQERQCNSQSPEKDPKGDDGFVNKGFTPDQTRL